MIRSYAPGFIFTTSLPPATVAGARASVVYQCATHIGDPSAQARQRPRGQKTCLSRLTSPSSPVLPHIVPVLRRRCSSRQRPPATSCSTNTISFYVQSINYPHVAVGEESAQDHRQHLATHSSRSINSFAPSTRFLRNSISIGLAIGRLLVDAGVGLPCYQGKLQVQPIWNDWNKSGCWMAPVLRGLFAQGIGRSLRWEGASMTWFREKFEGLLGRVTHWPE